MLQDTWLNVALVLVFILVGGVFAGTEMALVSLRESQVDRLGKGAELVVAEVGTRRVLRVDVRRDGDS